MRKALAVGAAVVVLTPILVRSAVRSGSGGRAVVGLVFGGFLIAAALGAMSALPAVGHLPPSFDPGSVSGSISPIQTGWGIRQPIVISFSAPMDASSVQAALRITPRADVRLEWDAAASQLYVMPVEAWTAGTIYTVSVGPGARSKDGEALDPMAPAIVKVRPAATAQVQPTKVVGERIALDSGFRMTFSRSVDLASLRDALTVSPAAAGEFALEGSPTSMPAVVWVPSQPLSPDTSYTVQLGRSAVDLEGAALAETPTLTVRTITRPTVVRFRPRNQQDGIDPQQLLSVRFSEAMDHASTRAAYHLFALGKDGQRTEVDLSKAKSWWAEGHTVLVVDPREALAWGRTYVAEVAAGARSRLGAPLGDGSGAASSATFTIRAKPAPAKAPTSSSRTANATATPKPTTSSGGGTSTAPWLDAEKYYLKLLNCTHTGGWLHADGSCTGYGSNGNPPLKLDSYLSDCASRPWAKYLAKTNQLYHGDVGGRFAECGYNVYWGENITWNTYDVYKGAISSVLFFQSEKGTSYDAHYKLLISSRFTHAGIGIWRLNGKNWYVVDFWGK